MTSPPPPMDDTGKASGSSDDSGVHFGLSSPPPSFDALRTVSSPSQLDSGHQEFPPSSSHSSPGLKHVSLPKVNDIHREPRHLRVSVMSTMSTTSVDTATSLNTEYNGPIIPPTSDTHYKHRTVVICFDGTGDEFDLNNSNIVQFFSVLKKGDRKRQIVYYQVCSETSFSLDNISQHAVRHWDVYHPPSRDEIVHSHVENVGLMFREIFEFPCHGWIQVFDGEL